MLRFSCRRLLATGTALLAPEAVTVDTSLMRSTVLMLVELKVPCTELGIGTDVLATGERFVVDGTLTSPVV